MLRSTCLNNRTKMAVVALEMLVNSLCKKIYMT
jgi:hypothetical protein